jgi:hypothetical protein
MKKKGFLDSERKNFEHYMLVTTEGGYTNPPPSGPLSCFYPDFRMVNPGIAYAERF